MIEGLSGKANKMLISVSSQWLIEAAMSRASASLHSTWSNWANAHGPLTVEDRIADIPNDLSLIVRGELAKFRLFLLEKISLSELSEEEEALMCNDVDRVDSILSPYVSNKQKPEKRTDMSMM